MEEENEALKKRVQELEKQVSDLAATNEVLLEQNAQFRLQKRYVLAGLTFYIFECETLFGHLHNIGEIRKFTLCSVACVCLAAKVTERSITSKRSIKKQKILITTVHVFLSFCEILLTFLSR